MYITSDQIRCDDDEVFVLGPLHDEMMEDLLQVVVIND